jgi:hypothetical protein
MKSDPQLKRWWCKYNALYFEGKLPADTFVFWETVASGYADFDVVDGKHIIRINPGFAGWTTVAKMALLHEITHQALHPYSKHGRKFHAEMLRLAQAGAFNDLW